MVENLQNGQMADDLNEAYNEMDDNKIKYFKYREIISQLSPLYVPHRKWYKLRYSSQPYLPGYQEWSPGVLEQIKTKKPSGQRGKAYTGT